jgi:hypothetical protein
VLRPCRRSPRDAPCLRTPCTRFRHLFRCRGRVRTVPAPFRSLAAWLAWLPKWSPGARSKCAGRSPARRHSSRLACDLGRLMLDGGRNQTGKNDWKSPAATARSTKSGLSGVGGRGRSRRPRLLGRRPLRSRGSIQDHAEAARIVCEAIPLERSKRTGLASSCRQIRMGCTAAG